MLRIGDRRPDGGLVRRQQLNAYRQWRDFYASLPDEVRARYTLKQIEMAVSFPFRLAAQMVAKPAGITPVLRVKGMGEFAPDLRSLRWEAGRYERLADWMEARGNPARAAMLRRVSAKAMRSFLAARRRRDQKMERLLRMRAERARRRNGEGDDA